MLICYMSPHFSTYLASRKNEEKPSFVSFPKSELYKYFFLLT